MSSLYEMTGLWAEIKEAAMDPYADTDALRQKLDSVEEDIREKAENYCKVITDLVSDALSARTESARLMDRARTCESRANLLRQWLLEAMKATGQKSLRTPLYVLSVSPAPASVHITDLEAALNSGYLKEPRMDESILDKAAMRRDLEAGIEIPGAELTRGETLRMR